MPIWQYWQTLVCIQDDGPLGTAVSVFIFSLSVCFQFPSIHQRKYQCFPGHLTSGLMAVLVGPLSFAIVKIILKIRCLLSQMKLGECGLLNNRQANNFSS